MCLALKVNQEKLREKRGWFLGQLSVMRARAAFTLLPTSSWWPASPPNPSGLWPKTPIQSPLMFTSTSIIWSRRSKLQTQLDPVTAMVLLPLTCDVCQNPDQAEGHPRTQVLSKHTPVIFVVYVLTAPQKTEGDLKGYVIEGI